MLILRRAALAAALLAAFVCGAFAQGTLKPKSSLNSEVGQQLPDNTSGAIAPSNARTILNDIIASSQQAPSVNAQTGTSYAVAAGDYGNLVTLNNGSSITATLPQPTGTLVNFNVYLAAIGSGAATVSASGGATINGASSVNLPSGSFMWFVSDGTGTNYRMVQNGTSVANNSIVPAMLASQTNAYGSVLTNCTIQATVAANAMTISILTRNGTAPTSTDACWIANPFFGSGTGNYAPQEITAALTLTVPSSATLGTVSGQANRIWVGAFNNGGTVTLAVYNSLSGTNILSWDESASVTVTGISAGSTSAQTWYGTAQTNNFRIIGYVESTQATAGTWATSPSKVQLFGPGQKKPGDTVQEIYTPISSSDSTASATFVAFTNNRITISVQSAANIVRVEATGTMSQSANNIPVIQLSRGTTNATNLFGPTQQNQAVGAGANIITTPSHLLGYDIPNTTGNVTYAVQGKDNAGTLTYGGTTIMAARETQI